MKWSSKIWLLITGLSFDMKLLTRRRGTLIFVWSRRVHSDHTMRNTLWTYRSKTLAFLRKLWSCNGTREVKLTLCLIQPGVSISSYMSRASIMLRASMAHCAMSVVFDSKPLLCIKHHLVNLICLFRKACPAVQLDGRLMPVVSGLLLTCFTAVRTGVDRGLDYRHVWGDNVAVRVCVRWNHTLIIYSFINLKNKEERDLTTTDRWVTYQITLHGSRESNKSQRQAPGKPSFPLSFWERL